MTKTILGFAFCATAGCSQPSAPNHVSEGPDVRWVAIEAGGYAFSAFTCGLTDEANLYCWGGNESGQLGITGIDEVRSPTLAAGGMKLRSISLGAEHMCGITTGDAVYCWGNRLLAGGTGRDALAVPVRVDVGAHVVSLASGSWGTCGLADDGAVICWWGYPNRDSVDVVRPPQRVSTVERFTSISAGTAQGGNFNCAISLSKAAFCWGDNYLRSLGAAPEVPSTTIREPVPVVGGMRFKVLESGYITCGITEAGTIACWGGERDYPPSDDEVAGGAVPAFLNSSLTFRSISVGGEHACALSESGAAYCWGMNTRGQLGTGSSVAGSNTPLSVAGGVVFESISAGNGHSCGITSSGRAYCWGMNHSGQLGDGSVRTTAPLNQFSNVPIAVRNPAR